MTVTREPLRRAHMPDERGSEERAETCDVAAGEGLEGGPELAGVGVLQPASNRSFAVRLISQRLTSPALMVSVAPLYTRSIDDFSGLEGVVDIVEVHA
jgi:hypothetical protein